MPFIRAGDLAKLLEEAKSSGVTLDTPRDSGATTRSKLLFVADDSGGVADVTYSTSITPDASLGHVFNITVTDGVAFAINAPTTPVKGQRITIRIKNTSGGAVGTITWNAVFKMPTWTSPATGFSRAATFDYDGTNWVEASRNAADVAN